MGESLPVVVCDLEANEMVLTETGAMSWMTENMKMETVGGGLGGMFNRMITGDSLFQNKYTAIGKEGQIAFASRMAGSIRAFEITKDRSIIVQRGGFLAGTEGVEISIHMKKKLSASLFGGEGLIMQKISGTGTALIEIDGYAVDYELEQGEKLVIDTGYLAVMDETCTMEVNVVKGVKNMLFGGEGIFHTVVTGPGHLILQTMPIANFAASLTPYLPKQTNITE